MSRTVSYTESLDATPASYDTNDYSWYSQSNISRGYAGVSNTSYAQINYKRGSNAETWVYYIFDTSSIPDGAVINSVSCKFKCNANGNTTNTSAQIIQLYSGTNAKGTAANLTTRINARNLDAGDSWTLEEIRDVRIRPYSKRTATSTSSSLNFRFYGATLTVEYTVNETYYELSTDCNSSSIVFAPSSGEYLAGSDVDIEITGDLTDGIATDNGVDVTSLLVGAGTLHTYSIANISSDHYFVITLPDSGQTIYCKRNGSWSLVEAVFIKQNGVWKEVETLSIKQNGSWIN